MKHDNHVERFFAFEPGPVIKDHSAVRAVNSVDEEDVVYVSFRVGTSWKMKRSVVVCAAGHHARAFASRTRATRSGATSASCSSSRTDLTR